ncbi:hypothetical protein [Streptomyces sp. SID13031]|uniref:hypothetical protein n=1 Tax=Streptomyces sp. SID13031 TaxID=2706046 RepID=UPI0013CA43BB|nr:hypothetical protein [Streptomyces sp. SID13031]NEA36076.1 hypothetical protein [Streptomyces sp. SID13031]
MSDHESEYEMFRRVGFAAAVLFLAVTGSVVTAGTSQAARLIGGHYGSANSCYNVINNSADLKAHKSFCSNTDGAWQIWQWLVGEQAKFYGGQYGRLDGCYNGIYVTTELKEGQAFCNVGSDGVYHIYQWGVVG